MSFDWLPIANSLESSYRDNEIGWLLYSLVRMHKPLLVVELGVLHGYSTMYLAAGLRDNHQGLLMAYDLWDDYPNRHGDRAKVQVNLEAAGLATYVSLEKMDAKDVPGLFCEGLPIDLVHVDLSNDGLTYRWAFSKFCSLLSKKGLMVLEGGCTQRDECEWMVKFFKMPIGQTLSDPYATQDWQFLTLQPYPGLTLARRV